MSGHREGRKKPDDLSPNRHPLRRGFFFRVGFLRALETSLASSFVGDPMETLSRRDQTSTSCMTAGTENQPVIA